MAVQDTMLENLMKMRGRRSRVRLAKNEDNRLPPGYTQDPDGTYRDSDGNFVFDSDVATWRKKNPVGATKGNFSTEGEDTGNAIRRRQKALSEAAG